MDEGFPVSIVKSYLNLYTGTKKELAVTKLCAHLKTMLKNNVAQEIKEKLEEIVI